VNTTTEKAHGVILFITLPYSKLDAWSESTYGKYEDSPQKQMRLTKEARQAILTPLRKKKRFI